MYKFSILPLSFIFRNINEFCHVLKQLPSFDDERLSSSSSGSSSSSTSSTSTNSKSKSGNPTTGIQSIAKSKESRNKNGVAPHPAEGNKMRQNLEKVFNFSALWSGKSGSSRNSGRSGKSRKSAIKL